MSSKKQRPSTPISDQDIREHLKRALLRFAANVQPAFYIDQETKFLSYRSDFPGFLGSGKKGGDHRTLKLCAAEPPIEDRRFTVGLTPANGDTIPNVTAGLKIRHGMD